MDRKLTDVRKVSGLFFFMITAVFLFITSSCQNGRGKAARDIFEKYEGQEGIYIFRIPPGIVNILLDKSGETSLMELFGDMKMKMALLMRS